MLADGQGRELARIRRVVMLARPNNGSEVLLSLRRGVFGRTGHAQERELRPLDEQVTATQRTIVRDVVFACALTARTCPIPFSVYAGASDGVVPLQSAQSVFPDAAALPGDHSSLLRATTPEHRTFTTLRRLLTEAAATAGITTGDGSALRDGGAPRPPAAGPELSARPRPPLGRAVETADPLALEVHRAIHIRQGGELPLLPAYVTREHDAHLAGEVGGP